MGLVLENAAACPLHVLLGFHHADIHASQSSSASIARISRQCATSAAVVLRPSTVDRGWLRYCQDHSGYPHCAGRHPDRTQDRFHESHDLVQIWRQGTGQEADLDHLVCIDPALYRGQSRCAEPERRAATAYRTGNRVQARQDAGAGRQPGRGRRLHRMDGACV